MRVLIATLLSCGLLPAAAAPGYAQTDPTVPTEKAVIARIGDTTYTLADIHRRLARLEAPYGYAAERRLPDYVREFVQREMFAREAKRLGLDHDPEVQAELEEAAQAILVRALMHREVLERAPPGQEAVEAYYREHAAEFRVPERVEVTEVVVVERTSAAAIQAAVKRGERLERAADAREAARVQQASITRGMREPVLEKVLFEMRAGEISEVLPTREGFSVFLLKGHYAAGEQPLAAVRPVIESRLGAQNQERLLKALQDRLWRTERVVISEDLLKAAVPRDSPPEVPKK
jgi:peptidyl-prolyl cis-trans isomerase C